MKDMKIPFDIKYKPQIESGEYKVETRDGRLVHNIWQIKEPPYTNNRKAEVCALIDGEEDALVFFEGGRYLPTTKDTDSPFDLFLITPEPELSEFEKKLSDVVGYAISLSVTEPKKPTSEFVKEYAPELLELARKELVEEQYTSDPRKTDLYKLGKAEALNDLPRWKKCADGLKPKPSNERIFSIDSENVTRESAIVHKGYFLPLDGLEKLPGFNE